MPVVVTRVHVRVPLPPHDPERQFTPTAHCALLPHWQPLGPQLSERVRSQLVHVAPLVPHCEGVPGETQLVPLQQPVAHETESQTHAPLKHR